MTAETLWYLVRTKARQESIAAERLTQQGFGAYHPRLVVRRRRSRPPQILPLFPTYVFVSLLLGEQDFSPVRSTKGVLSIVRFGEDYARVPVWIIAELRRRADPLTGLYRLARRLRPRMPVRVKAGPFEGMEGIFLHESGRDRCCVLLQILGAERSVKIAEEFVEPLPARSC